MKILLVVPAFNEEGAMNIFYRQVRYFKPFQKYDGKVIKSCH